MRLAFRGNLETTHRKNKLHYTRYLFLTLVVASLQLLRHVKLEVLAEALPLAILFESRPSEITSSISFQSGFPV
ncbi:MULTISPECIES: hypothetical protein [Moorena]|uniref:hypothetical protein n=1 Tax=Moorena TaxID=1155738 RepID=UPI00096A33BE|nr:MULTISPECIES: hypothetical protein [Moorena]NEQ16314.1 hypothetical protein [Moorena sp. SIO3E2]NES87148.1 hypothetical protein [Moorena sp. SIO2B7]NEP34063.1 hypothetical protein [Moorena sp. SIO3B2]NEQ06542.1 hypothetical protein [Moorena sp. SIO4E2]NER91984.1 hypothetical protein [Moorena sp. SIO3A2]